MKKIKMEILKITPEPNPDGSVLLRIKAKSDDKTFEFGAKEEDYYDDVNRESIHNTIFKRLRKEQEFNALSENDRKTQKEEKEKKRAALVGTEVDNE